MASPTASRRAIAAALPMVAALALGITACSRDGREMRPPRPDQFPATTVRADTTVGPIATGELPGEDPSSASSDELEGSPSGFALTGPWPRGGPIPARHTCDGDDLSPSLRWFGVPAGTVSLALVAIDPDAGDVVHWIIANLDPDRTVLPEDTIPPGAVQATNDIGTLGWSGPCPPPGPPHRYVFRLHALDQQIEVPDGSPAAEFLAAIDATTVATAVYEGRYPES